MSFRAWVNFFDQFTARCPWCSHKIRTKVTCHVCKATFCSQSCGHKHVLATHGDQIAAVQAAEQAKRAAEAKEQRARALEDEAARIRGRRAPTLTETIIGLTVMGVLCA